MNLHWKVDECAAYFDRMKLRGWCHVTGRKITQVEALFFDGAQPVQLGSFGLVSPDIAAAIDPAATHNRFDEWVALPEGQHGRDFTLRIHVDAGEPIVTGSVHSNCRDGDAGFGTWYHFLDTMHLAKQGGDVLEIGSRARSGISRRGLVPTHWRYTGLDVLNGPNVDVVGDAHALSTLFPRGKFNAIYSHAVFEHLAMPWKVVVEMNRVLAPGGLVFVSTQQTWPVHEEPCDFWRYSAYAWKCLFNSATGFEVVESAHGEPARVHPLWDSEVVRDMHYSRGYLWSSAIARKIGETTHDWPIPPELTATLYPAGESGVTGH